jgi:septal ring factor EnvC (AmiA/AmiB activator)
MTESSSFCHFPVIFTNYTLEGNWLPGIGRRDMKKHYTALLAAFAITICIGAGMLLISLSALMNKNGVPVANSIAAATATAQVTSAEQAQIQQLQNLVTQYQTREVKYQSELQSAGQDLQQVNNEIRQYQMLLMALQSRGYITIDSSGQITIR